MRIKDKKFKIICVVLITLIINFASISSTFGYKENQYVEVIVFFEPNESVEVSGVEYIYQWDTLNAFNGRIPYSTYELLKKSPSVKFITTEIKVDGFMQLAEIAPFGIWQIEADRVWGGERSHPAVGNTDVIPGNPSGQGIKVAIIDSGIDYNHNDLESNYGGGINYVDISFPLIPPMDYNGHGTGVAGIIAAVDNEIDVIGVAPHSTIYAVKAFESDISILNLAALLNSIVWCIDNDMDIISMSWGFYPNWWPTLIGLAIALDIAYANGIVLVAGTGNYPDSPQEDHVLFPASLPSVIAIGASNLNGERVDIASSWSSCYGPEVDFIAPGLNVKTTKLGGGVTTDPTFSGTSAAVPHVVGIIALLLSQDPTLTPSEIKTILQLTAEDAGVPGQDDETGFGLVNAYGALDVENPMVSITNPSSYDVSGIVSISASASDNYRLHKVQFKIDSGSWYIDYDAENGWSWNWNTFSYSNGIYTIFSRAYDARGNWAQTQKTVNVNNYGGGGGCPILSVYNGSEFIEEGLLDIHNPDGIDVVTIHELVTEPKFVKYRGFLRLTEHPITISHIDKVELYGRLSNGLLVPLALKSAFHSSLGNVLPELKFSDDNRVDILGAIHNNGTSEFIDIEFKSPPNQILSGFIFIIEGHNYLQK